MFKSIATAVLVVSFAGAAVAQDKYNATFLAKSHEGQMGYIETSLAMAQALLSKSQGECIGKWAQANQPNGYKELVQAIAKHKDFHPSGVIAAAMEKVCGKFELAQY